MWHIKLCVWLDGVSQLLAFHVLSVDSLWNRLSLRDQKKKSLICFSPLLLLLAVTVCLHGVCDLPLTSPLSPILPSVRLPLPLLSS